MVEGGDVRMPLARIDTLVGIGKPELLEETERIAVPRRHIDLRADPMMIELGEEAHEIMRDVPPRRAFADDLHLHRVERCDLIGRVAAERQPVRRIGFGHRQIGQVDLVEAAILHRPEDIAPCGIERVDAGVSLRQPAAESG